MKDKPEPEKVQLYKGISRYGKYIIPKDEDSKTSTNAGIDVFICVCN